MCGSDILDQDWTFVRRIMHDHRDDRPNLTVPFIEEWKIPKDVFEKKYGTRMTGKRHRARDDNRSAGATIDNETWRDFGNPNMVGSVMWENRSEKETFTVGYTDGKPDPSKWAWKRCKGHLKCKKPEKMEACPTCKRQPPKRLGKQDSRPVPGSEYFHLTKAWVWDDQIDTLLVPELMSRGVRTIWAHNATVELIGLLKRLEPEIQHPLHHYIQHPSERSRILFKGSGILTASLDLAPYWNRHNETYSREEWSHECKDYVTKTDYWVELRDSVALMPVKLATIGKALGFPKGETPSIFTDADDPNFGNYMAITNEDVEYCIRDCEVLWRGLQDYWRVFREMGYRGKELPLTVTGLGWQMIAQDNVRSGNNAQAMMFKKKQRSHKWESKINNPELDDICRKAFVGGRTQVWDSNPYHGPSLGIDANSMYPSQLISDNPMPDYRTMMLVAKPDPSLRNIILNGAEGAKEHHFMEGVVNVHWKRPESDKIGLLSHRLDDGSLSWTETEGTRWITFPEYRMASALGYDLEILVDEEVDGCMVTMPRLNCNLFGLVKTVYDERVRRKNAGDGTQFYLKIWLNGASFGAWATRVQNTMLTTEEDAIWMEDDWEFKGVSKINGEMIGYAQEEEKHRTGRTANIMAAYITAQARIDLFRAAQEIGADRLLYCDTDSWKFKGTDTTCYAEGNDLGQWKIEQRYDFWHSVAPKQYRYRATWDEEKGDIPEGMGWNARIKGCSLNMACKEIADQLGNDPDQHWNEFCKQLDITGEITFDRVMSIKETLWQVGKENAHEAGAWNKITKSVDPNRNKKKPMEVKQ